MISLKVNGKIVGIRMADGTRTASHLKNSFYPNLVHGDPITSGQQLNWTAISLFVYSIALNSIRANICAKIKKTATVTPAPAMIDACWRINSVVTFRHPLMCSVSGDGASMHGFRCPPYVSWQHDSGMFPYQSRYDSMPQQRSRVCVSSQADVIARRLPYSGSVEYISWRIVWMTFSRKT